MRHRLYSDLTENFAFERAVAAGSMVPCRWFPPVGCDCLLSLQIRPAPRLVNPVPVSVQRQRRHTLYSMAGSRRMQINEASLAMAPTGADAIILFGVEYRCFLIRAGPRKPSTRKGRSKAACIHAVNQADDLWTALSLPR